MSTTTPAATGRHAATTTTSGHIPAIQGLRAIAILLVVAYHADLPIGAGYVGVDVFFVISGFVITAMVLRQSSTTGKVSFKRFWAGRVRRLLPALTLMVIVTMLLAIPFESPIVSQKNVALTGIGANLWVSNGVLAYTTLGYFAPLAGANPLLHTWSLAVEEQFYIFFPILVAVGLWWARRGRRHVATSIGVLLAVVAAFSLVLCIALTYVELPIPIGEALAFYSPLTRAWEFAIGAGIALALHRGWRPARLVTSAAGPLGLGLLVLSLVIIRDPALFPGWLAALPAVGTGLIILACTGTNPLARVLATKPMTFIGDVSYGWYLFHWPALVYVRTFWKPGTTPVWVDVTTVVVALGLAYLSYRFIEQPIRHRQLLGGMRTVRLVAAFAIPSIILSSAVYVGQKHGWGIAKVSEMQAQLDHGQWKYQAVCQSPEKITLRDMSQCTFPGTSSALPVILLGDSNAGVYADVLKSVTAKLHRTLTIATTPGCSLVDVQPIANGQKPWINCIEFEKATLAWVKSQPKSLIIVASNVPVGNDHFTLKDSSGRVTSGAAKQAVWQAALERTFRTLTADGHQVLLASTLPEFAFTDTVGWTPQACQLVQAARDPAQCGMSESLASLDATQSMELLAERAAAQVTGVPIIDVRSTVCAGGVCRTNIGNRWLFEDGAHLTYPEAMTLAPLWTKELLRY